MYNRFKKYNPNNANALWNIYRRSYVFDKKKTKSSKLRAPVGKFKRFKRGQNLTKSVYWFSRCTDISSQPDGTIFSRISPNSVFPTPSFVNQCLNWSAYKIVQVKIKMIPSYIGSESSSISTGNRYWRGNCCSYIVQGSQVTDTPQQPVAGYISNLMGAPSAKLHQPRATIIRYMNRPSGGRYANWAEIRHPQGLGTQVEPDAWNSEIRVFGDNFGYTTPPPNTNRNKPYYFVQYWYKVVFRARWRGGVIQPLPLPLPVPVSQADVADPPQEDQSDDKTPAVPP